MSKLTLTSLPLSLTIAGSDCSAGAGAQADLKTFSATGTYGTSVMTSIVAEVPGKVGTIEPLSPKLVSEQLQILFENLPIASVKTGLLAQCDNIVAIANILRKQTKTELPLVVDPVMVATSGDSLLPEEALQTYRDHLFPLATVLTPNLDEATALWGSPVETEEHMRRAGPELVAQFGCAILLKGGHLHPNATEPSPAAIDLLFTPDGEVETYTAAYYPGVHTHGTGCTLSAAICSYLAQGYPLKSAIGQAKTYVNGAIARALRWKTSAGEIHALHHFWQTN